MNVGSRLNVQVGSLTSETAEMLMGGVVAISGIIGVVWLVGWGVMRLVGFPAHRKVASDSAHQRRTGDENAPRSLTEDQAGVRQAPAPAPESLTVKGRARYVWLYGWLCGAAYWFAFGLLVYTHGDLGVAVAFVAVGLVNIWVAVRGFRRRIVADAKGVTINNLLVRRVVIRWNDLRSIDF